MKNLIGFFSLAFFIVSFVIRAQCITGSVGHTEINFQNNLSVSVTVSFYPVSAIFTNDNSEAQIYQLKSRSNSPDTYFWEYINGNWYQVDERFDFNNLERVLYHYYDESYSKVNTVVIPPNVNKAINFDPGSNSHLNDVGSYGYGRYKFEFSWIPNNQDDEGTDYCYYETDAANTGNDAWDMFFIIDNGSPSPEVKFIFLYDRGCVNLDCQLISSVGRNIKVWAPYNSDNCNYDWQDKNFGNFKIQTNYYSNIFPLDPRLDCILNNSYPMWRRNQNQNSGENNTYGILKYNLTIEKNNLSTPTTGYKNDIILQPELTNQQDPKGPFLKIAPSKTLTLNPFTGQTYGTDIIVNEECKLWLDAGTISVPTVLNVNSKCRVTLQENSELHLGANSQLRVNQGGSLYSYCAYIHGQGSIVGKLSQIHIGYCDNLDFSDSIKMVLEDSVIWTIDPNTTITFDGPETLLEIGYNSQVKFGYGSKLILKNGARISANNCKFTSLDSSGTWDGIYLEDNADDTISNCIIENAYNGINIENGNSPFVAYSTQITGCTFDNTTDTQLVSCIYVNNSDGILIKDCIIESDISNGYSAGIITEYCSTNGVIIIDNEINNTTTGIAVIQSSPYIARNIITGLTGTGTGILLDNSNGTIEYNIVNNFQKSISTSYSSPYLLKNTFSDASDKNMDLTSNSFPVMKPVVSASSLRWLGGNNTITGTPSNSGIAFADCYPLMDSGYNRVIVNGSDYMNGAFSMQYTTVNARINYWYDSPPQSSLFDVSSGTVNYDNYFDGSTLPSTSGYELNTLGFGLYDTVYTNELGDTPTPEDLFMQAYVNEMQSEYDEAIVLYKDVISSFKTSSYAPVSLSRIFNCLEKDESTVIDYQLIQSYYNSIKSDTNNSFESRELSEDFVIKSKVKQGLLEDAISDYDDIYQQNANNSKGQHALINKICLMNMYQGGDNQGNGSPNIIHKTNLLALLKGSEIRNNHLITSNVTPIAFKLHQNYPNPFNPQTKIKYDIPRDNFVTIKIYDLLGREIFNSGEFKKAGSYEVKFDGSNYASGMYFYTLESGNFKDVKKMVLLK